MKIIRSISELKSHLRMDYKRVLVPTMGALHQGHASLIEEAHKITQEKVQVIVSIFVNPTQFDRQEDLTSYPSTEEQDIALCMSSGADLVFIPSADEMYFPDRSITITEASLSLHLCGATRPGHFNGVGLICTKLFNLTQATDAIFGKKDYQQIAIIKRLVRDLNTPINIIEAPTVRDAAGLALSSRNLNLTKEHKPYACEVFKALNLAKTAALRGEHDSSVLIEKIKHHLEHLPISSKIDYLNIVSSDSLKPLTSILNKKAVIAIAVFFGNVRLIDNIEIKIIKQ